MEVKLIDIGSLVVCIWDDWNQPKWERWNERTPNKPIKGSVYTVRAIDHCHGNKLGIYLVEIVNPKSDGWVEGDGLEPCFNIDSFRPVKKTNIDCFTQILKNIDRPVETV